MDVVIDRRLHFAALDEVGAEKLRCIAERLQCRDLYDMHALLHGDHVQPLEIWDLYLRKAENDVARKRQRTPPREWSATFERRMTAYRDRWDEELADYLSIDVPAFGGAPFHAVFIRAPIIESAGPDVEVLAVLEGARPGDEGSIVAARQGNLIATSFHPELTRDGRFHDYFLKLGRA